MKTILVIFLASLGLALLLTPVIAALSKRFGLVDLPSGRKVHTKSMPRIGGIAVYLAFYGSLLATLFYSNDLIGRVHAEPALVVLAWGSALVFLIGLADDIFSLHPMVKFGAQTVAAILAYSGGVTISQVSLPWTQGIQLGWLSLPITVFWFLLVTNAFNLIDGLDGLAAGVCFFSSLVLLCLSIIAGKYIVAAGLAALAGACLGFLRYNFNPASIFMGDCGSYFIGYILASLSVLGSVKSQATVAILIPIIALGLPLMDTVLAPIRRFVVGKKLFRPDKSHIHHRLLQMGFSHRNAVLLLYAATIFLGLFALILVYAQDRNVSLMLLSLGAGVILAIRKLGYLEYLAVDKVIGYLRDITDEMGFSRSRRTFLNHQVAIDKAADTDEMWLEVISAVEALQLDMAQISFNGVSFRVPKDRQCRWCRREIIRVMGDCHDTVLSMNLPLLDDQYNYGVLYLKKNLLSEPMGRHTLGRIEHLRRSIVRKLEVFQKEARDVDGAAESLMGLKDSENSKCGGCHSELKAV